MVRWRINGREVTSNDVKRLARISFKYGEHGLGRYSRPKNTEAAARFLNKEIVGERFKVESYNRKTKQWW